MTPMNKKRVWVWPIKKISNELAPSAFTIFNFLFLSNLNEKFVFKTNCNLSNVGRGVELNKQTARKIFFSLKNWSR